MMCRGNISDLQDLTPVLGRAADLDENQLAGEMVGGCQVPDDQDIGQFVQLLGDLVDQALVAVNRDGNTGNGRIMGGSDCQTLDIESAAGK